MYRRLRPTGTTCLPERMAKYTSRLLVAHPIGNSLLNGKTCKYRELALTIPVQEHFNVGYMKRQASLNSFMVRESQLTPRTVATPWASAVREQPSPASPRVGRRSHTVQQIILKLMRLRPALSIPSLP